MGSTEDNELVALEALHDTLHSFGSDLKWWPKNPKSACDIPGVECHPSNSLVRSIDWTSRNLVGTLPTELGVLSHMKRLGLGSNAIMGTLPMAAFYNLSQLEHLELYRNQFSGQLPGNWSMVSNHLKRILMQYNGFTGTLSSTICQLEQLHGVDLFGNSLTGTLPECLGNLSNLQDLQIHNTLFTGILPPELCDENSTNKLESEYGCDGIACPMHTYSPHKGKQQSADEPCIPCPTATTLASTTCPTMSPSFLTFSPTQLPLSSMPSSSPSEELSTIPTQMLSQAPSHGATLPSSEPSVAISSTPSAEPSVNYTAVAPTVHEEKAQSESPWPLPSSSPYTTLPSAVVESVPPSEGMPTGTPTWVSVSTPPSWVKTHRPAMAAVDKPTIQVPWLPPDVVNHHNKSGNGSDDDSTNWVLMASACLLSLVALATVVWARRVGRHRWYIKRYGLESIGERPLLLMMTERDRSTHSLNEDDDEDDDLSGHNSIRDRALLCMEGGATPAIVDNQNIDELSVESDSGWNDTLSSVGDGSMEDTESLEQ